MPYKSAVVVSNCVHNDVDRRNGYLTNTEGFSELPWVPHLSNDVGEGRCSRIHKDQSGNCRDGPRKSRVISQFVVGLPITLLYYRYHVEQARLR